jgi:hypothetical protein
MLSVCPLLITFDFHEIQYRGHAIEGDPDARIINNFKIADFGTSKVDAKLASA